MKTLPYILLLILSFNSLHAQHVTAKSDEFTVDLSDPKNLKDSSVPLINWLAPLNETIFLREAKLFVRLEITSPTPLKTISLTVREKSAAAVRGSQIITPKDGERYKMSFEKNIAMPEGVNVLELVVENADGVQSKSFRIVHVGETALADAAKLNRHDYAVLFITDKYDNWGGLVNPIFDGRALANQLEKIYGFKVDVLENPSQDQIFRKLREYSEKKYEPLDQVMIFFAGHGYFDETFKEGYVVMKESLKDDPGKTSYLSYNRLRNVVNSIPSEHTLLMMDVCFGGTFDDNIANSRGDDAYKEISQSEYIIRKLAVKTRKYLTSGGKQYVSDGVAGKHSPFAKRVLDALGSFGGTDGILTLTELWPYVEKLNPEPKLGKFGDDAPGSEFVFVVK
ncbi:MAG TPA: caspase family protein [Cyclobacteriaceae bacterium]|nr:caspase family protein [Cyclobacteriaceae bacterium]